MCGQPLKIELTDAPLLRKGPTQNTSGNTEKSIQKPNLTPCKVPVKNDYPEVNLNWDYSDNEEFLDSPSEGLTPLKSKLRPCPIPRNKRGRKKIGEPAISPVIFIDHNTIAAYGNVFKLKRISKNDGNSIIKCEICNRKFKMKSVRSHVISKLHQDKFS